jgi:hypothetical protein
MEHLLVRPSALLALALCTLVPVVVSAQQFFTPGAEVNGHISVQVNATLNDGIGEYQPVSGLTLTLYRGATDRVTLRTDDAGVLRFAIAPGSYRLSTPEPVYWHGRSYRWNVPLVVQPRMGIVSLTVANAVVGGPSLADPPQRGEPAERAPSRPARSFAQKDGAVGVLFGFLLTGAGSSMLGRTAKARCCSG